MDQQNNKNWWRHMDPMTALLPLVLAVGILATVVALVPVRSNGRERHRTHYGDTNR